MRETRSDRAPRRGPIAAIVPEHAARTMAAPTVGHLVARWDGDDEIERLLATIDSSKNRLRAILGERESQLRMAARMGLLGGWTVHLRPLRFVPSPEWLRIHDVEPPATVGLRQALRLLRLSDRDDLFERLRRCAEEGEPFDWLLDVTTASGRLASMRILGEPEVAADGTVLRINGACQDVTLQVARAQELERHRSHLEELVEQRTRDLQTFAYALAHDVRAPIAAMAGFAQVLTERLPADAKGDVRHYAGRIVANAARAEALVAGILSLVQVLDAPIVPTRVDLSALANEALEALAGADPARPVQVQVQPGLAACGDPRLLDSVLSNLLANAWKFTRERDPARIAVGQSGDGAFFVRDNGVGVAPQGAARRVQPRGRRHSHAGYTGTGLGLATAQRIVQRHGGAMWAEAQPGRGATFWFTLPSAAA